MNEDESLESIREVSDVAAKAHLALFLYQAVGFGLAFAIWQVLELEEPWYRGPWHFLYFGWLVIYLAYAQYARRCRDLASVADECVSSSDPPGKQLENWWQRIGFRQAEIPWWLRLPLFLLVMLAWPAILGYVAMRHIHSVVVTPAKWPEAAVLVASVLALFLVPTYGPGPLLVTAIHVALVVWLRRSPRAADQGIA